MVSSQPPPGTLSVQTADNVALGYVTAGLGSRMVAQLLDNGIALTLVLAVVLVVLAAGDYSAGAQEAQWAVGAAVGAAFLVYFGYFLVSEAASGGRTPGKAAMGLRVVRLDGSAADFTAILVRNLVRIIDVGVLYIGVLFMFFHAQSRRLGDLAAGTVVVRERQNITLASVTAPVPMILRTPDAGPAIDGVDRLGTHEEDALRVFLSRQGLTPQLRAHLAGQMAAKLYDRMDLPWPAPERQWPPELFLERLYLQMLARGR